MNAAFFATLRVSGLASNVTAINFSKIFAWAEPRRGGGGGGARAPHLLHTLCLCKNFLFLKKLENNNSN